MRLPSLGILIGLAFLWCALTTADVRAIGSGEKHPDKEAADNLKKATAEYNKGVKHLEKAQAILAKGDSAYAFNYRATSDAKASKELQKAMERFAAAVSLDKRLKEAWNNLGYCHRKLGSLEESIRCYNEAIALDSNYVQAREYRGETYLALGNFDNAMQELYFLKRVKSPYADTLAASIEFYNLERIRIKLPGQKQ
jgi:tetratricopeptide (TPR) repeat protein